MAGKGGYQPPASPAPVSGPGRMSQRTDGGPGQPIREMTGGDYGDSTDLRNIQASAPMAASGVPQTQGQRVAPTPPTAMPTPLGAPTERPDEPVTAGNDMGPGAGSGVLTFPPNRPQQDITQQDARALSPHLPELLRMASQPNAPQGFVRFVRRLRDAQGGM